MFLLQSELWLTCGSVLKADKVVLAFTEIARPVNVLTVSNAKMQGLGSVKPVVRLGAEGQPGDKTVKSCSTV